MIILKEYDGRDSDCAQRIALNPEIARRLGWTFDRDGLFRWVDSEGDLMAETIWWKDGPLGHQPPEHDDEVGEGWLVVVSGRGVRQMAARQATALAARRKLREEQPKMERQLSQLEDKGWQRWRVYPREDPDRPGFLTTGLNLPNSWSFYAPPHIVNPVLWVCGDENPRGRDPDYEKERLLVDCALLVVAHDAKRDPVRRIRPQKAHREKYFDRDSFCEIVAARFDTKDGRRELQSAWNDVKPYAEAYAVVGATKAEPVAVTPPTSNTNGPASDLQFQILRDIRVAFMQWKTVGKAYGPDSSGAKQAGGHAMKLLYRNAGLLDDCQRDFGASTTTQNILRGLVEIADRYSDKELEVGTESRWGIFCADRFIDDLARWAKMLRVHEPQIAIATNKSAAQRNNGGKGGRRPKYNTKFCRLVRATYEECQAKGMDSKAAWNKAAETHGLRSGDAARISCRRYLHAEH